MSLSRRHLLAALVAAPLVRFLPRMPAPAKVVTRHNRMDTIWPPEPEDYLLFEQEPPQAWRRVTYLPYQLEILKKLPRQQVTDPGFRTFE